MTSLMPIVPVAGSRNMETIPVYVTGSDMIATASIVRLKKALVTGTTGVAIPGATAFCGISVTTLLAGSFARFYDAASATGDPFCQLALTELGVQIIPLPVELTNGLYVAPSIVLTTKFWVFYL